MSTDARHAQTGSLPSNEHVLALAAGELTLTGRADLELAAGVVEVRSTDPTAGTCVLAPAVVGLWTESWGSRAALVTAPDCERAANSRLRLHKMLTLRFLSWIAAKRAPSRAGGMVAFQGGRGDRPGEGER
jgi:hypothetical protein